MAIRKYIKEFIALVYTNDGDPMQVEVVRQRKSDGKWFVIPKDWDTGIGDPKKGFWVDESALEEVETMTEARMINEACRPETDAEKKAGIKIEHEHLPTLKRTQEYFEENGKFPPIELFAEWIHDDHTSEFELYYNAETGLPAMEEVLKDECGKAEEDEND